MNPGNSRGRRPLYRKLCEDIRRDIASGIYQPGEVLPSIREKARTEGVARNTVDAAYQLLAEEGFIQSRRGVGYIVLEQNQPFNYEPLQLSSTTDGVNVTAPDLPEDTEEKMACDFRYPVLLSEYVSSRYWNMLSAAVYRETIGQSEDTARALRKQIRRYLKKHRGITCSDEQIYLCRNLRQAIQMIRRIQSHLLYVVPHHEGKLGNHISKEEEELLLSKISSRDKTGSTNGVCIVEDDIDSELVYKRRPYPTLFGRDQEGRVILTGTLERIAGSLLPIQYVVFPERLLNERREIFEAMGRGENHSLLEFKVMEIMMRSEYWEGFLRKVNHRLTGKRDLLIKALKFHFKEKAVLYRTESGPEIIAAFPYSGEAGIIVRKAGENGVGITARTGQDTGTGIGMLYVTLRYAAVPEEAIENGIAVLSQILMK